MVMSGCTRSADTALAHKRELDEARKMCEIEYDGEIPEGLHLADVIEKYVVRALTEERDQHKADADRLEAISREVIAQLDSTAAERDRLKQQLADGINGALALEKEYREERDRLREALHDANNALLWVAGGADQRDLLAAARNGLAAIRTALEAEE
jgi:septal ring factor EnvC (AmiA/AmiB activator)